MEPGDEHLGIAAPGRHSIKTFTNLVLQSRMTQREKTDLVEYLRAL